MPRSTPARSMTHAGHSNERAPLLPVYFEPRPVQSNESLKHSIPVSVGPVLVTAPTCTPEPPSAGASSTPSASHAIAAPFRAIWRVAITATSFSKKPPSSPAPSRQGSSGPAYQHATILLDNKTSDVSVEADGQVSVLAREQISQRAALRGTVGEVTAFELLHDLINASFATTTRPPVFSTDAALSFLSAFTADAMYNNMHVAQDLQKAYTYRLRHAWTLKTPWHVIRLAFALAAGAAQSSLEQLPKQIKLRPDGGVELQLDTEVTLFRDERLRPDRDSERHVVAVSLLNDKIVFLNGMPLIASRSIALGSERIMSWQYISRTALHKANRSLSHQHARTEYRHHSIVDEKARKRSRRYARLSSRLSQALGFATVFLTGGTLAPSVAFIISQRDPQKVLLGWIGVLSSIISLLLTFVGWLKERNDTKAEEAAHARDEYWSRNTG